MEKERSSVSQKFRAISVEETLCVFFAMFEEKESIRNKFELNQLHSISNVKGNFCETEAPEDFAKEAKI